MNSLKVVEVVLRQIELPLKERFEISSGWVENRRILLLRLRDADGATCWSECVAGESPNYSSETVDTAWFALTQWLVPRIMGREVTPNGVGDLLDVGVQGHYMAKAALEMGAFGLAATKDCVSLASLVGGTRKSVATGVSLGLQPTPEDLVAKALAAVETGYRKVKLKVSPGRDVSFVAAVREALELHPLAVDANAAYTLDDIEVLRDLDRLELIMIEQPLAAGDLVRHARLQAELATPVCLDESITVPSTCEDMLELGSGRIINIKPGRVVGSRTRSQSTTSPSMRMFRYGCGGMLESGIGRAYNVAIASLPNFQLPGDLSPSARYWARDIVYPEWTMSEEGFVEVPLSAPGLGIEVDEERVEALTLHKEVLRVGGGAPP